MSNTKVFTPATPSLIELWRSYPGAKSGCIETADYFSNTNQDYDTGYFTAEPYEVDRHKEVSEQEFINVIYNRYELPKQG